MDDRGEPEAVPCSGESAPTTKIEVDARGTKRWYRNGKLHREDGPAIESVNGTKVWLRDDKLHREDGPAVEYADGTKEWYCNDVLHREDGPAIEWADGIKEWYRNGTKEWYYNGARHRGDGPAVESANGSKEWYLHGIKITEHEHRRIMAALSKLFIAVCVSRRNHVPRGGKRWLPAELWGYLAENYFDLGSLMERSCYF